MVVKSNSIILNHPHENCGDIPGEASKQRQLLQCLQRVVPAEALAAVLAALVPLAADVGDWDTLW